MGEKVARKKSNRKSRKLELRARGISKQNEKGLSRELGGPLPGFEPWGQPRSSGILRLAMLPMPGALRGVSVFAIGFGTVGTVPA